MPGEKQNKKRDYWQIVKALCKTAWQQKCPHCQTQPIFKSFWSLETPEKCSQCGFTIGEHDSGDGPAVFLSFILGFSVIPVALVVALNTDWPLWVHTLIWSPVILLLSVGLLKPSKAITIALQYKHRPRDWDTLKNDKNTE